MNLNKSFEYIDSKENKTNLLDFIEDITPYINKLDDILKDPEYKSVIEKNFVYNYACDLLIKTYCFINNTEKFDGKYIDYISDRVLSLADDIKAQKIRASEFYGANIYLKNIVKLIHIDKKNSNIDINILKEKEKKLEYAFKKLEDAVYNIFGAKLFEVRKEKV